MYTKRLFFLNLSVETPSNGAPARLRMDGRSDGPMKAYRVSGTAPFGSQRQPFSYDVPAADADAATLEAAALADEAALLDAYHSEARDAHARGTRRDWHG